MAAIGGALPSLLSPWEVTTVPELEGKADRISDGTIAARRSLEELVRDIPGLPDPDETANSVAVMERFTQVRTTAEGLRQAIESLDVELLRLQGRMAQLSGQQPINIARAELELADLQGRHAHLLMDAEVLAAAYVGLKEAVEAYQVRYRGLLEQSAGDHFVGITGRVGRRFGWTSSSVSP